MGDAARLAEGLRELYGSEVRDREGVLHVVACWQADDDAPDALRVIRVAPGAPTSPTDRFALQAARARADALVTTGRILRSEPGLDQRLPPPDTQAGRRLWAWRRETLDRREPARSVVLTRGDARILEHPLLRTGHRPIVLTTPAAAPDLQRRRARSPIANADVEIVGLDDLDLRRALGWLRSERQCRTVLVEAGPSSAADLYREPVAVDELLLSVLLEDDVDPASVAAGFATPARVDAIFGAGASVRGRVLHEPGGRWRFSRLRRD